MTGELARPLAATAAALAGLVVLVAAAAGNVLGASGATTSAQAAPSPSVTARIPAGYLAAYQQATAASCPGLSWTVLAAIGTVETANGTSTLPGVHAGANSAGAEGPMQFEPATFARYATPVPPGGADPPSPYDPADAIYAAARFLCANGAATPAGVPAAVFAYNHSSAYVNQVLTLAASYAAPTPPTPGPGGSAGGPAAARVVAYAQAQIGTPYRWGGESAGVAFDCSGLTQAAYAAAGITIPRTSETQYATLPHIASDAVQPGDLVFFNPGENGPGPGHVGIYIGNGQMIDAPTTGALVRVDTVAGFGTFVGAARPAA